jgi:hypothetical protein
MRVGLSVDALNTGIGLEDPFHGRPNGGWQRLVEADMCCVHRHECVHKRLDVSDRDEGHGEQERSGTKMNAILFISVPNIIFFRYHGNLCNFVARRVHRGIVYA